MQITVAIISALILVGLYALLVEVVAPWAVVRLAHIDRGWSPFRLKPPEGEFFAVVRGGPDGPFDKFVESVRDFELDQNKFVPLPPGAPTKSETYFSALGVVWVGFFRRLYKRELRYDKFERLPDSTEWGLVHKERAGPNIYFQYNMATMVKAAETVGNFPVDALVVFTLRIIEPVKALFFAGGWETQVNAAVQGVIREYIGTQSIDKLREEIREETGGLVKKIKTLELMEKYGIEIIDARFVEFDLIAGDAEMTRATRAVEMARLNAEAARETAGGKRDSRKIEAEGIREEYAARMSVPQGAELAMAEAIRETRPGTLVLGSASVAVPATPRTP